MSEWKEIQMSDILESANTGLDAIKRAPIVSYDSGIKCLRIQDISQEKNFEDWGFCEVEKKNYEKFQLKKGDIIVARTGATVGVNRFISQDLKSVYNNGLIRLRTDKAECLAKFLFYNLRTNNYKGFIESISGGTSTQPNMQINALVSFDMLLPDKEEQEAVVDILSSLDDKIDLLHRQNQTLEQMAETLFRQWFVEEADDGWEDGVLGDLVEVKYGKDHKKLLDGTIPVYGSGGFMRGVEKPLFDGESVLIPRKGTLNNVMYVNEPFWTVDTMFYTIMKRERIAKFIYQFIKQKDLASMNVGSAVPSMTTAVLNNMPIEVPPKENLDRFDYIVSELYDKIKFNQTQIRTLTALRDTLLPKLMGGEVRVVN